MENKLPMDFNFQKAKQSGNQPVFIHNVQQTPVNTELTESIKSHIELQILQTTNVDAATSNPAQFIADNLVNRILFPYYMQHKIDNEDLVSIIQWLQNKPTSSQFAIQEGLQTVCVANNGEMAEIDPKFVAAVIIKRML